MWDKVASKIVKSTDYANIVEIIAGLLKGFNDTDDDEAYLLAFEIIKKLDNELNEE